MTFIYTYKTSDGVRHEAEIDAKRREDAFAALRAQGIRPIRVEEKPMTPRERLRRAVLWAAAAVVLAACAAGAWVWARAAQDRARYQHETRAAFEALRGKAEAERKRHREEFAAVDFALLRNYALVERSPETTRFEVSYIEIVPPRVRPFASSGFALFVKQTSAPASMVMLPEISAPRVTYILEVVRFLTPVSVPALMKPVLTRSTLFRARPPFCEKTPSRLETA